MTFKDIAKQLTTAVQTVPNLVQILRDGFEQAEAGSGSSIEYSTTEKVIGKWIDGSDLYEKTIDIGAIEATLSKDVAHGISIGTLVSAQGSAYNSSTSMWFPIPYVDNDASYQRYCYVTDTNVRVGGAANAAAVSKCYVTIRYTKPAAV